MKNNNIIKYRPEIDGIRALAVLLVIFCHAEFTFQNYLLFEGGYIGVDIFFVISGYLISSIILYQMKLGVFSFSSFYIKRVRRLLPVLMVVLLFSMSFSWLLLLPLDLSQFSWSLLSVLGFFSNMWFLQLDGYWAPESLLQPLHHTWSLAVEEQFYIIFPVLLYYFYENKIKLIIVLFFSSFFAANYLVGAYPDLAFYAFPLRAWEILSGVFLSFLKFNYRENENRIASLFFSFLGFVLIFISVLIFDSQTKHPSLMTALPVIGTMLLIRFLKYSCLVRILKNRVLVFIGLLSYGLYLWHFPLFSFARMAGYFDSFTEKITICAICFLLSLLTYHFVELKFRYVYKFKAASFFILSSGIVALILSSFAITTEGIAGRVRQSSSISDLASLKTNDYYIKEDAGLIINVGDSHAGAIRGGLRELALENSYSFVSILSSGILPLGGDIYFLSNQKKLSRYSRKAIDRLNEKVINTIRSVKDKSNRPIFVVLTARYPLYLSGVRPVHPVSKKQEPGFSHFFTNDGVSLASFDFVKSAFLESIKNWTAFGVNVLLVYPVPEMIHNVPEQYFRKEMISAFNVKFSQLYSTSIPYDYFLERSAESYSLLDILAETSRVHKVHPEYVFCNKEKNECSGVADNLILYRDDDHLSDNGAIKLSKKIMERIESIND